MNSLIFFGSDQYAKTVLEQLIIDVNCHLKAVVTDRPKPVGRNLVTEPNPVEKLAKTHNIKVSYYPSNQDEMIKFNELLVTWSKAGNIKGLCASFDHLLPPNIIEIFAGNLYNLHPSLLPQYRNVSPVQYAIALGDRVTGITLFRISPTIDNGEILAQIEEVILPTDTTSTLTPRLFKLGAELFLSYDPCNSQPDLEKLNYKDRNFVIPPAKLIFTHRLTRDSGFIEWPVLQKLLANQPPHPTDTKNELLSLRLGSDLKGRAQHADTKAGRSDPMGTNILSDLLRALTPWPTVWTIAPSKKGELRITIESVSPEIKLKIAGKPNPISYSDFTKYYL